MPAPNRIDFDKLNQQIEAKEAADLLEANEIQHQLQMIFRRPDLTYKMQFKTAAKAKASGFQTERVISTGVSGYDAKQWMSGNRNNDQSFLAFLGSEAKQLATFTVEFGVLEVPLLGLLYTSAQTLDRIGKTVSSKVYEVTAKTALKKTHFTNIYGHNDTGMNKWMADNIRDYASTVVGKDLAACGKSLFLTLTRLDPSHIATTIGNAANLVFETYALFQEWKNMQEVNAIFAYSSEKQASEHFMTVFEKCPILLAYLIHRQTYYQKAERLREVPNPSEEQTFGRRLCSWLNRTFFFPSDPDGLSTSQQALADLAICADKWIDKSRIQLVAFDTWSDPVTGEAVHTLRPTSATGRSENAPHETIQPLCDFYPFMGTRLEPQPK